MSLLLGDAAQCTAPLEAQRVQMLACKLLLLPTDCTAHVDPLVPRLLHMPQVPDRVCATTVHSCRGCCKLEISASIACMDFAAHKQQQHAEQQHSSTAAQQHSSTAAQESGGAFTHLAKRSSNTCRLHHV
jgi:hypothetical protein